MIDDESLLRHLTLGDGQALVARASKRRGTPPCASLSFAAESLVKLGALVATDGSDLTWQQVVGAALDAGVTRAEIVDALVVLAPLIGSTRIVEIAPKVALAVGYDVTEALESR